MKMPKMFQGKKSRGQEVSPSSMGISASSLPSPSQSVRRGGLESQKSYPVASERTLQHQISTPAPTVSHSGEIEEVVPKKSSNLSAEDQHEKELAEAFRLIDVNGDGHISASELGIILQCLGDNATDDELELMVKAVDADGNGQIDLQEFINLNKMTTGTEKGAQSRSEELRAAFHVFDIDRNNQISAEELHQVLKRLGEQSLTMEECSRMINSVDSDGDGFVNFEEFEKMMSTPVY